MCMISQIVFTDKYLGHAWTFYYYKKSPYKQANYQSK